MTFNLRETTESKVFAPGNISCIFQCVEELYSGRPHSLGLSFTIREGVTVTVRKNPVDLTSSMTFNDEVISISTVLSVLKALKCPPVAIDIHSPLPLGYGFGLSGAMALASAMAINDLFLLSFGAEELGMIAHRAEVDNLTGLGDVTAQLRGGCVLRSERGYPLRSSRLSLPEQPVYYKLLSPLSSSMVLSKKEELEQVNRAGSKALAQINSLISRTDPLHLSSLLSCCRQFSEESGLIRDKELRDLLDVLDASNIPASMIMLGNAVYSPQPFEGATQTYLTNHHAIVLPGDTQFPS